MPTRIRMPEVSTVKMNTCEHVYLSPHLDDAVLSCGGSIWQRAQAGERVLALTLFAGIPPLEAALSPFARELHARWGDPAGAAARRREEDLAALALLGAEAEHWDYLDCIYRRSPAGGFPYASEGALWGGIDPAERELVARLAARIAALRLGEDGALYVPLAVGHHVDHQIARRAAELSGQRVIYYEEFPYAAQNPRATQVALAGGQWRPELVPLSEGAMAAKIAAIACYGSQISTFWADAREMAAAVRAFAEHVGNSGPAERYWMKKVTLPERER